MFVDSLLKLSTKVVAKSLAEDRYQHLDITLEAPLSDQVFSEVTKLKVSNFPSICSSIIAKESGLKLNLTHFDSNSFSVDRFDMENLCLHDIRSLVVDLDTIIEIEEYMIEKSIDIARVFRMWLNEESCQNLRELKIKGEQRLHGNWTEQLGKLLPNLQSFNCHLEDTYHFPSLCESFPNLVALKPSYVDNLEGIRYLKNLQLLTLYSPSIDMTEFVEDLLELLNLRVLDVTGSSGFFEYLLLCDGTFQTLKFIECSESDITETQLRELVKRHPSLKSIALLGTSCDYIDFSDLPITVLNFSTFESTIGTIRYTLLHKGFEDFGCPNSILRLAELLENGTIRGFKEEEFLKTMMKVTQKCPPLEDQVTKCLISYFKRFFPDQSMKNIIKNLDPKSALFIERRWAAQTVSRYFPDK
uniref:FBD domain-containing protein n=1 Tax=Caenorhabditis tropicalis TaxID=1561998 RepID=A0A1I7TVL8_9PELO